MIPQPAKSHLPAPYVRPCERYNYYSNRIVIAANLTDRGYIDVVIDGVLKEQIPFSLFDELEVFSLIAEARAKAYLDLDGK